MSGQNLKGGNFFASSESHEQPDDDEQVFYSKDFVNKFFAFESYSQASEWIIEWFRELKHNPTDFTKEFPALVDAGTDY